LKLSGDEAGKTTCKTLFWSKHIRFSYPVFYLKSGINVLLFSLTFVCFHTQAQTFDTIQLNAVEIKTTKINYAITGRKLQTIDSTTLDLFKNQTLADLLASTTPIFIKNYGPGALSSTSFRGGNASQTAVLWNGLNIQNSMLGQVDLSNISNNLFNDVSIEYGGSSALWGSGAVGGAIHLGNTLAFNKPLYTKLNVMGSDIGLKSIGTNIGFSDSKFSFCLKAFGAKSENEFSYYEKLTDKILKQKNAGYEQITALPEFKYQINSSQIVSAAVWLSKGLRNFPSQNNLLINKIQQQDESQRFNLNWNLNTTKVSSIIKTAYFIEHLNYSDSVAAIDSKSKMNTFILENDNYYNWLSNQTLNLGINYTSNEARTENYNGTKTLNRVSFILGNKSFYLKRKLVLNTTARLEHTNSQLNPFTFNIGANYSLTKSITLKLNGGKVYRIPTLNDLYWLPGGNPLLKPEEGYTVDGTIEYNKNYGSINIAISGSAFHKDISNWILWLPANGYSSPMNVQRVWSRGTETTWQLTYASNGFKTQLKCITGYVLSTVKKSSLEEDNTVNHQLIYTPRYTVNTMLNVSYKSIVLSYFHNYVGYRFTSSDNSTWLDPFHYSSYRMTYNHNFKKIQAGTFININNVLNSRYEILANRPMPLRYFEIGIQINYNQSKNK